MDAVQVNGWIAATLGLFLIVGSLVLRLTTDPDPDSLDLTIANLAGVVAVLLGLSLTIVARRLQALETDASERS